VRSSAKGRRFLFRRRARGKLLSPDVSILTLPFQADMAGFPFYANGRETEMSRCAKRGNSSFTISERARARVEADRQPLRAIRSIRVDRITSSPASIARILGERRAAAKSERALPLNLSKARSAISPAPEKRTAADSCSNITRTGRMRGESEA